MNERFVYIDKLNERIRTHLFKILFGGAVDLNADSDMLVLNTQYLSWSIVDVGKSK